MKFGLYTDTHFGIFSDDDVFLTYQLNVIKKIHDYYKSIGVNQIMILGDIFDNRRKLNTKTMEKVYNFYKAESEHIDFVFLLGNHDFFNKFDGNYSSVRPIFRDIEKIHILDVPISEIDYDGFKILYCNWIFDEEEFKYELKKYSPNLILGHFEMKDFEMIKGHIMKTGIDKKIFKNKELVISGHYHIRQEVDNVVYLGAPYQMDWPDYGVKKYYYAYDTDTRKLEDFEQENEIFLQLKISGTWEYSIIKNKIVKLIIDRENNAEGKPYDIKKIMEKISEQNPFKFQVVDNRELIKEVQEEIDTNTDILTITKEYIEKNISEDVDKDKLFEVFSEVYKEARTL